VDARFNVISGELIQLAPQIEPVPEQVVIEIAPVPVVFRLFATVAS